jgi:hypothetical protein
MERGAQTSKAPGAKFTCALTRTECVWCGVRWLLIIFGDCRRHRMWGLILSAEVVRFFFKFYCGCAEVPAEETAIQRVH